MEPHPIYKNYGAKKDGSIWNMKTGRNLKLWLNNCGYLFFKVFLCGKGKNYLVHRFVYECFKGNIPPELEVDHKDNDKQNNSIDNLQLLTHVENIRKSQAISIVSICIQTGERRTFPTMLSAAKTLEVHVGTISNIVNKEKISTQSKKDKLWYRFENN